MADFFFHHFLSKTQMVSCLKCGRNSHWAEGSLVGLLRLLFKRHLLPQSNPVYCVFLVPAPLWGTLGRVFPLSNKKEVDVYNVY